MVSAFVLLAIVLLAVTSIGAGPIPGWWHYGHSELLPNTPDDGPTMSLPAFMGGSGLAWGDHPFGIDNEKGRDLFAMTMRGVQVSLVVIIVLALLSVTIGVLVRCAVRLLRWMARRHPDAADRRDPGDPAARRGLGGCVLVPARPVSGASRSCSDCSRGPVSPDWCRAEVLTLREREYVDAARVAGASTRRIIFKHILPNTVGTIVVSTTLLMGGGILTEAALSFLGFGIQAPNVSLGSLVFDYQGAFSSRPWLFVFPGLFIITIVLCLQFIGDGLRDAFDPRQKRIPKFKDLEREQFKQASVDRSRAGGF